MTTSLKKWEEIREHLHGVFMITLSNLDPHLHFPDHLFPIWNWSGEKGIST